MATLKTDGSSPADAHPRVEIDTDDPSQTWRYRCPNGHSTVQPTNGGLWCRSCARHPDVEDPHWHELIDRKTGARIPWSAITFR